MRAKRAPAPPKPDWRCRHCGAVLSAKTTQGGHEASLSCQATQNRTAAKERGLDHAHSRSALAVLVAEALFITPEQIFDSYRKGAWRPGRKSANWYVPAWIVELCIGFVQQETQEEVSRLVHQLAVVMAPAVADLEVRSKLQAVHALGGSEGILAIYRYAEEQVAHAATA